MVNPTVLEEIERLEQLYQTRWGRAIDAVSFSLIASRITQEQYCLVLRRVVDTGESCLVGYDKVRDSFGES